MTFEQIKWFFQLLLWCAAIGGPATVVWFERNDHWEGVIAKQQAQDSQNNQDAMTALGSYVTKLETIHNEDLDALSRRPPVERVLLPCSTETISKPEAGQLYGSRPASSVGSAQSAFDDFTRGLEADAHEWGSKFANCKVDRAYIEKLP